MFSTLGSVSSIIPGQLVATKQVLMHEFYIRHYFNVIIFSISERRYRYWQQVDEVINQTGTIFDVPPATVPGNLFNANDENEQVFGYFEAAAVDTSRFFVTRGNLPFYIPNPCGSHPACNNCLSIENSSAERPYYFGQ